MFLLPDMKPSTIPIPFSLSYTVHASSHEYKFAQKENILTSPSFFTGCTEKPDTVRYEDTVRYRTDSRGRFSISRGGITVLASTVNRTREGGFLYTLAYKEGGNRAS